MRNNIFCLLSIILIVYYLNNFKESDDYTYLQGDFDSELIDNQAQQPHQAQPQQQTQQLPKELNQEIQINSVQIDPVQLEAQLKNQDRNQYINQQDNQDNQSHNQLHNQVTTQLSNHLRVTNQQDLLTQKNLPTASNQDLNSNQELLPTQYHMPFQSNLLTQENQLVELDRNQTVNFKPDHNSNLNSTKNNSQLKSDEQDKFVKMFENNLNYLNENDLINFMQYQPEFYSGKPNPKQENIMNGGYIYDNITGYVGNDCYASII